MSDLLLQEIDEELRRDKALAFWKRHGKLIAGVAVAFIIAVAAWRGYDSMQRAKAAGDGDRLFSLMQTSGQAASNDTLKKLQELSRTGTPAAATLARFNAATDEARLGDIASAVKSYDAIAADASLSSQLRDIARVRGALLVLQQGDNADAIKRMTPLAKPDNEFRHAAREILGLAAYSKKDLPAAARWFEALVTDLSCPPATRNRGQMMIALLAAEGMPLAKLRAAENPEAQQAE